MDLAKESVYWGIRIMIISIAIIFIILILGSLTNYNIYVDKVESYVIRNKIIIFLQFILLFRHNEMTDNEKRRVREFFFQNPISINK